MHPWFIMYSALLAIDALLLINYTLHILLPLQNLGRFGWAFVVWVAFAPYLAVMLSFMAAFKGSVDLMKQASNLNTLTISINIPFACLVSLFAEEDPVFFLMFAFMILVKMGLSATAAKVRQYLVNPRFGKNHEKLKKILRRQNEKLAKRQEILGRDMV